MSVSDPFVKRPVATTLLTIALFLAGAISYFFLPVAPLPQVELPTISVSVGLPGASPETMASSVATPLERMFTRIAGITEMTSTSSLGSTNITLQFDLNQDADAAAREVQAAINAARSQLPAGLPNNPTYRKVNPSDAPIMILGLTSKEVEQSKIYDLTDSIIAQKLSQIEGVGQVNVGGGAKPAVRVQTNPAMLAKYGISLAQVRQALNAANVNRPKGMISGDGVAWQVTVSDQLFGAKNYKPLVIRYRAGSAVRLEDIADVTDSIEDRRTMGLSNGEPSVMVILFRQPDANIIETTDRVRALLPQLKAALPPSVDIKVMLDRTSTIRASVDDVRTTMLISIALVVMVVFLFLRNVRATIIPGIVVPLSLVGAFGVMYLLGFSVNNLTLMALTIATGFVVDDAIVVIENIARYLEEGMTPMAATLRGAREIGFTVFAMSTSLVAVFIPILLMGGVVGRLFREFAVTLSAAIAVSMVVSLTTTPMMCSLMMKAHSSDRPNWFYRLLETGFNDMQNAYAASLRVVIRHPQLTLVVALATVGLNVYLYTIVPKGFFPQQDSGRMMGMVQAAQDISFPAMSAKMSEFVKILMADPAIDTVSAFTGGGGGRGGGSVNTGRMFIQLKPKSETGVTSDEVIARLRRQTARIAGAQLFLQAAQDVRVGGRQSNSQFQFSLQGDNLTELRQWGQKLMVEIKKLPGVLDSNSDLQDRGLEARLVIDRETASRLSVDTQAIDDALYDAFGQRQVSTMYGAMNQYHVVMEVMPGFQTGPADLRGIYVASRTGAMVPLA